MPECTYTDVTIYKKDHIYLSSIIDELADSNVDHSVVFRWCDEDWKHRNNPNAICGMIPIDDDGKHSLLNVSIDGKVVEFLFPDERSEQIDTSSNGPNDLKFLRCVRKIGNRVYVAGMARMTYVRNAANDWENIAKDIYHQKADRDIATGFNTINGVDEQLIYAAGYAGEIWSFVNGAWSKEPSPTNVILNDMVCLPDGQVYICGMAGTLVYGKAGQWKLIEQEDTTTNFWSICKFKNQIYVSGDDGIFIVEEDGLTAVDIGDANTSQLDANDELLCSVGEKDFLYTEDGESWIKVPNPF